MSTRQPTIHDVAAASGLSRGTVSRFLNGGKNVSPVAAAQIERAIKQTGYRVNGLARGLRAARSDTVAFLLPQEMDLLFTDPVHGILARECSAALARRELSMVLLMAGDPVERDRAVNYIRSGHVDGVLVVGLGDGQVGPHVALASAGIPVVVCEAPPAGETAYSTVSSDSRAAIAEVVRQLRAEGRERIAFLGGVSQLDETRLRHEGYLQGLDGEVDEKLVQIGLGAADGTAALLARTDFDALVCVNDIAAARALPELQRAGRRVPEDVAVVGFDNIAQICTSTRPELSSVAQDFAAIADAMADRLVAQMAGEAPAHVQLTSRLVRRESF